MHTNKKTSIDAKDIEEKAVAGLYRNINSVLQDGFKKGLGTSVSKELSQALSENVSMFSGAKTYAELKEMSALLVSEDGLIKPFADFSQAVTEIYPTYNQAYLEAEYEFANTSATMATRWQEYEEDGDRYDLQYRTANDGQVRPEHQNLHDTTLPASDSFWDEYFPPNGWNCRCEAVQVRQGKYERTDSSTAQELGAKATSGKGEIFRFNPGKKEAIFPDNHPYIKELSKDEKSSIDKIIKK